MAVIASRLGAGVVGVNTACTSASVTTRSVATSVSFDSVTLAIV